MDSNEYGFKHNFKNSSDFAQKKKCKVYNQRDYNYYNNSDYANIFWLKPESGVSKTQQPVKVMDQSRKSWRKAQNSVDFSKSLYSRENTA